ncbi:MAG: hypothetical protein ACRDZ5_06685, partial [Acidimicrobiales bacterium]
MPDEEGLVLSAIAELTTRAGHDTIVEIGAWCGRSALYLAAGIARALEEMAPGSRAASPRAASSRA